MKIVTEWRGQILILHVQGSLTGQNSDGLVAQFRTCLTSSCQACILSLQDLSVIDSSGVGALVTCLNESRTRKIPLRLAAVQGQPRMAIKVARAESFLPLFDTVEQALAG